MVKKVICPVLVLINLVNIDAYIQTAAINLTLYPTARSCANETGVTAEQIQAAKRERDINQITACFFKCCLYNSGLIIQNYGKEKLDVPTTLVFAKIYIPTITLLNLLPIAAEVIDCATEFENEPRSDDHPDCPKTKVLVNCLVEKKTLINAIRLATQG